MNISPDNRNKLLDEIKFVLEKMKAEEEPNKKLYYFSAIYGVMNRIYNLELAPDLIFAHFVLSSTHSQINARLHDPDKVVSLPDGFFDKLIDATEELFKVIKNNKNPYESLKKFVLLGYVVTGNGYYLFQRGLIKI